MSKGFWDAPIKPLPRRLGARLGTLTIILYSGIVTTGALPETNLPGGSAGLRQLIPLLPLGRRRRRRDRLLDVQRLLGRPLKPLAPAARRQVRDHRHDMLPPIPVPDAAYLNRFGLGGGGGAGGFLMFNGFCEAPL